MKEAYYPFGNSPWNSHARRELLEQLATDGLSGQRIAERINEEMPHHYPLTRSAVIGACLRMGITLNSDAAIRVRAMKALGDDGVVRVKKQRAPRVKRDRKSWGYQPNWSAPVKPPPPPPVDDTEKPPLLISLTELTSSTCRWPIGDPRQAGFGFCGHQTNGGLYCGFHKKKSVTPGSALKTPLKPPPEKNIVESAA